MRDTISELIKRNENTLRVLKIGLIVAVASAVFMTIAGVGIVALDNLEK